jgi:hypothetical protein
MKSSVLWDVTLVRFQESSLDTFKQLIETERIILENHYREKTDHG